MLQDVIKCITKPIAKLGVVFYLFIITFVIFATFGLEYFERDFIYENDTDNDDEGCHSVVACFWSVYHELYKILPIFYSVLARSSTPPPALPYQAAHINHPIPAAPLTLYGTFPYS